MEHSTGAVSWQPRNYPKAPGQLRRNSLQHVARGADFVGFFQWRASTAGAEQFHSAMVPHAGTDSRVWREVVELGRTLRALGEVAGSRVQPAEVAMLLDYEAWWASESEAHPSNAVRYLDRAHAFYRALWNSGVPVDVVHPAQDLDGYRLAIVPTLYLVSDRDAAALQAWVRSGGHAVVTYFSGIVDPHDQVRLGGYPGAFRELLGIRVEEFAPLPPEASVTLDDGGRADLWTEDLHLTGATAVTSYADGPWPGVPAVTRNPAGTGVAWYIATRTDARTTGALVERIVREAGVAGSGLPEGVERVRRTGGDRSYVFVLNHRTEAVSVEIIGDDLVSGRACEGWLEVPAGGVACVRERGS